MEKKELEPTQMKAKVNVEAEVRRFKEDLFLRAINKTLTDIYSCATLKMLIIKEDETLEHIYDDKTIKYIKGIETIRNDYIETNYNILLKNA